MLITTKHCFNNLIQETCKHVRMNLQNEPRKMQELKNLKKDVYYLSIINLFIIKCKFAIEIELYFNPGGYIKYIDTRLGRW